MLQLAVDGYKNAVPTHVRVNRGSVARTGEVKGCPHACGGEPAVGYFEDDAFMLSPRMWG